MFRHLLSHCHLMVLLRTSHAHSTKKGPTHFSQHSFLVKNDCFLGWASSTFLKGITTFHYSVDNFTGHTRFLTCLIIIQGMRVFLSANATILIVTWPLWNYTQLNLDQLKTNAFIISKDHHWLESIPHCKFMACAHRSLNIVFGWTSKDYLQITIYDFIQSMPGIPTWFIVGWDSLWHNKSQLHKRVICIF